MPHRKLEIVIAVAKSMAHCMTKSWYLGIGSNLAQSVNHAIELAECATFMTQGFCMRMNMCACRAANSGRV
jgi:hypothetical protein